MNQGPRPIIRCQKGDGRRVAVKLAVDQPITKKWVRCAISQQNVRFLSQWNRETRPFNAKIFVVQSTVELKLLFHSQIYYN